MNSELDTALETTVVETDSKQETRNVKHNANNIGIPQNDLPIIDYQLSILASSHIE